MLDSREDNTLYVPKPYRGCVVPDSETQHWSFENSVPHLPPMRCKDIISGRLSENQGTPAPDGPTDSKEASGWVHFGSSCEDKRDCFHCSFDSSGIQPAKCFQERQGLFVPLLDAVFLGICKSPSHLQPIERGFSHIGPVGSSNTARPQQYLIDCVTVITAECVVTSSLFLI